MFWAVPMPDELPAGHSDPCDRAVGNPDPVDIELDGLPHHVAGDSITMNSEDTAEGIVIRFVVQNAVDSCVGQSDQSAAQPAPRPGEEKPYFVRPKASHCVVNDLASMIAANRAAQPAKVYSGFHLVQTSREPSPEEQPYVGAFLPLQAAKEFPELLALESIDYSHAYCNESLPAGTRLVIRPGKFRVITDGDPRSIWGSPAAILVYLSLAASAALLAAWFSR